MEYPKIQFTLRLGGDNYAKIRQIARANFRSTTNMIEFLIKAEIDRFEQENGPISLCQNGRE